MRRSGTWEQGHSKASGHLLSPAWLVAVTVLEKVEGSGLWGIPHTRYVISLNDGSSSLFLTPIPCIDN